MAGLVFTLGYLTLAVVTVLLFSLSFLQSVHEGLVLIPIIILLILVGLVIAQINEFLVCLVRHIKGSAVFDLQDFASILLVLAGAQVTFYLSVNLNLGNVLAASLTGILAALLLPKYAAAAYCGAFVGMSSPELFATPMFIFLAGIVAGALFVASKTVFANCGGKLGTIAFTGCIAASLLMDRPFVSGSMPAWDTGALLVFYSVLAALTTRLISIRLKHGPIMGSAIVGLLGSLFLPVLHPERGSLLAVMAICASFAGMSDPERIPTEGLIALAGLFTALIFMFTSPYLGGAGGKLGTIAFGSVSSIQGMLAVFHVLKNNIFAKLPGN